MKAMRRDERGKIIASTGHDPLKAKILSMLDGMSVRALKRMGELVESEDERVALAASIQLVDRRFGKPKQETEIKVESVDLTALHLEALRRMAELTAPRTINGDATES